MKLFTVSLMCLMGFAYTQDLNLQQLGDFSLHERQCLNKLHANETAITNALKQLYMPENDPSFNKFMECTWKKDGFIAKDGSIILERFRYYVKGAYMDAVGINELAEAFADDTINHCKDVRGNSPGQTGVKLMNCILHRLFA